MHDDYIWFIENAKELYEEYGDCFIAIKNKRIIGVFQSYAEGVKKTLEKESMGAFIVQKCGCDESAYTNYISSMNF